MKSIQIPRCSSSKQQSSNKHIKALALCAFMLLFFTLPSLLISQGCPSQGSTNQLLNGSFDSPVCQINGNVNGAINIGCAPDWMAAHGTPSLCSSTFSLSPFDGTPFACLGSASSNDFSELCYENEAMFQNLNICPGVKYRLVFHWGNILGSPGYIHVGLTNGLVNVPNTALSAPCFEGTALATFNAPDVNGWQTETVDIIGDAINNQLVIWITPGLNSSLGADFAFDGFSLTCIETPLVPEFTVQDACLGQFNFAGFVNSDPVVGVASWCWDFGDGTAGSGQNVSHTYASPGTYQVCLTISDNCGGCTAKICHDVVYNRGLAIVKTFTEDPATGLLTFSLNVGNGDPTQANNVLVTDALPNTLSVVNANGFTVTGNTLTQLVNIPPNTQTPLTFTVRRNNACTCTAIENCASAVIPGGNCLSVTDCVTVPAVSTIPDASIASAVIDPVDCYKVNVTAAVDNPCYTHTWNFGDGTSGTGASTNHVYTTNGTYTVTHTVTNDCGPATATVTVVINCTPPIFQCGCSDANTLNIDAGNGTNFSALQNMNNYDQNNDGVIDATEHHGCIAIAGRLIVDRSLSITGAEIRMQPCSEIIVRKVGGNTYPTLSLNKNVIHGCLKMWHGITVDNNCKLILKGENATYQTIKDAEFAVSASGGSDYPYTPLPPTAVSIQYNSFELNHVGIYFPGVYIANVNLIPLVNNDFKGPGTFQTLLPSCTQDLENYDAQYSYAGIISKRVDLYLGSPTSLGFNNTFKNLRNGVIVEKATANIFKNDFQNIVWGPAHSSGFWDSKTLPSANNSYGIAVLSNFGNLAVTDSRFNVCGHAVFGINNFLFKATTNRVISVITGFEFYAPIGVNIRSNTDMGFHRHAIKGSELISYQYGGFTIGGNTGTYGPPLPGMANSPLFYWPALKLSNMASGLLGTNGSPARISSNTFNFYSASQRYGFDIKGTGGWTIDDNTITSSVLREPGFKLEQSNNNRFYSNHVTGGGYINNSADNSAGYFLTSSSSNLFCCNTASDTRYGHRFMMICDGTKMRHSDMTNHQYAVHCSGGYFGQQYDEGNLFNTTSGIAFHNGDNQQIQLSQFRVLNTQTPHYPEVVDAPNQTILVPWILTNGSAPTCDQESNEPNLICTVPSDLNSQTPRYLTESDRIIAEKGFESENPVLQWEGERRLYADLNAHPDLLGSDHLIDTFYNRVQSGEINAVYEVEQALAMVRTVPSSYNAALISIRDSIDAKTEQINQRLSALSSAHTENDSTALYLQANRILTERSVFSRNLINLQEQMKTERLLHVNASIALVNSLVAGNVYKQNFKTVSRIYLETIAQDIMTLSPSQFSAISAIAHQCIFEGGTAVLDARMLYQLHEAKHFSDDTLCQQIGHRAQHDILQRTENQDGIVSLVPNPANETVTIQGLRLGLNEVAIVDLLDIKGNTIVQYKTTEDQPTLDLRNVANGVYLCRIIKGKHALKSIKIVVIH
jgi:PKD repeat protein